jgi:large subunit ribosomal protein L10
VDRAEKQELIGFLQEVFKASGVVVVAHYSGLTVAQMQQLRKPMKQAGATVKVAKNRLAKSALDGMDVA